jgi:hypothetical protein
VTRAPQSGQTLVEYLILVAALAFALFYPISHQQPVFEVLLHALINAFRSQSFVISFL